MREASTVSERARGDASTRLEERAFGKAGTSFEAHARFLQSTVTVSPTSPPAPMSGFAQSGGACQ
jgi:hypothetical protein